MTASPCISVCRLDPESQTCIGCGRTIAEIAAWPSLTEPERAAILRRLELGGRPPGRAGSAVSPFREE